VEFGFAEAGEDGGEGTGRVRSVLEGVREIGVGFEDWAKEFGGEVGLGVNGVEGNES